MPTGIFGASRPPSIAVQLSDGPNTVADGFEPSQLPIATWGHRRFVLEALLANKGGRGRKSWIQREGIFIRELEGSELKEGGAFWLCRRCDAAGAQDGSFQCSSNNLCG